VLFPYEVCKCVQVLAAFVATLHDAKAVRRYLRWERQRRREAEAELAAAKRGSAAQPPAQACSLQALQPHAARPCRLVLEVVRAGVAQPSVSATPRLLVCLCGCCKLTGTAAEACTEKVTEARRAPCLAPSFAASGRLRAGRRRHMGPGQAHARTPELCGLLHAAVIRQVLATCCAACRGRQRAARPVRPGLVCTPREASRLHTTPWRLVTSADALVWGWCRCLGVELVQMPWSGAGADALVQMPWCGAGADALVWSWMHNPIHQTPQHVPARCKQDMSHCAI
jgi:hypothetical protein